MSEVLGPLSYAKGEEHIFLGREIAQHRDYSEETARKIDEEINSLIDNSYKKAKNILEENLDILHALADRLLEKETVMGAELDDLISSMRPGFEFPSKAKDSEAKTEDTEARAETETNAETAADEAASESEPQTNAETETD
jgi:cell division protease FtsH